MYPQVLWKPVGENVVCRLHVLALYIRCSLCHRCEMQTQGLTRQFEQDCTMLVTYLGGSQCSIKRQHRHAWTFCVGRRQGANQETCCYIGLRRCKRTRATVSVVVLSSVSEADGQSRVVSSSCSLRSQLLTILKRFSSRPPSNLTLDNVSPGVTGRPAKRDIYQVLPPFSSVLVSGLRPTTFDLPTTNISYMFLVNICLYSQLY